MCRLLAVICVASVMPSTSTTGALEPVCAPLPSCPKSLLPQHAIAPVRRSAQVWPVAKLPTPAVICAASVMPSTSTGTEELVFVALPS